MVYTTVFNISLHNIDMKYTVIKASIMFMGGEYKPKNVFRHWVINSYKKNKSRLLLT